MRKSASANIDGLITYLFESQPHLLKEAVAAWLGDSRRFDDFVAAFRDKIRKKLRVTRDPETLEDLRLELETAYLLLQERSLGVVYEPQLSGPGRGPDFAVSFTTSLTFTVEVTRLRAARMAESPPGAGQPGDPVASSLTGDRLTDAICSKLGQFLPHQSNVLIVGVDAALLTQQHLQTTMSRLQQRAEGNDPAFWKRYGFRDRADLFRYFLRLSEVLLRESRSQPGRQAVAWINPQAKHPLPSRVRTALYRSHGVGNS